MEVLHKYRMETNTPFSTHYKVAVETASTHHFWLTSYNKILISVCFLKNNTKN